MTRRSVSVPSKSQVDRAGWTLRRAVSEPTLPLAPGELNRAIDVVDRWRASFRQPLDDVLRELEEFVASEAPGSELDVSGRPKRLPSITRKLARRSKMRLSQMEDIGGCRAKLPDAAHGRAVLQRVFERWPDAWVGAYSGTPQATGYRAVHAVVTEGGRRIEIQLRTPGQNRWADEVERWSDRLGYELKNCEGPAELVAYFRMAAERIAVEEGGGQIDQPFEKDFEALREHVRPYFRQC